MSLKNATAVVLSTLLPLCAAAAGALDPAFGDAGRAAFDLTPIAQQGEHGSAVALRSDGKIVVVSETRNATPARILVSRHNADGSLDATFGANGQAVLTFGACGTCSVTSPSLALLDTGAILVAATEQEVTLSQLTSITNIAVTRLGANGAVDTSFGTGGVARINPSGHSIVYDIAVQLDGRILVAGSTGPSGMSLQPDLSTVLAPARWLVARLTGSGAIDSSFVDRVVNFAELAAPSAAQRIAVQASGHIVVIGKSTSGLRGYRYRGTEADLRAFASTMEGDFADLAIDGADRIWALAALPSGSELVRFTPQLEVDPGFVGAALPRDTAFVSVLPLTSGEAFVGGGLGFVNPAGVAVTGASTVMKLASNGGVDTSFGDGGRLAIDHAIVNRLALSSNGRVVAVGAQDAAGTSGLRLGLLRIDPATASFVSAEWMGFPVQSLGTRSSPKTLTVTNSTGSARTITVTGSPNFEVQGCAGSLAVGASCQLTVTHLPTTSTSAFGFMDYTVAPLVISDGGARQATLQVYTGSEKSLVQHYFRSILRRDADANGWSFWNSEARRMRSEVDGLSGASGTSSSEAWFAMAMAFYASAEYTQRGRDDDAYVTDLYRTFYDRTPDSTGLAFWRSQLAQGLPREVILNAFMFSSEFAGFNATYFAGPATRPEVDLVMDMYRGLLGRLPDTGGLAFWVGRVQKAQCQGAAAVQAEAESISSQFAGGSEYASRGRDNARYVADLYNAFLRRASDVTGFTYWRSSLDAGSLTRDAARRSFLGSAEFNARVQAVIAAGCRPGA